MTSLALRFLFGGFNWLREALSSVLSLVRTHPLAAALIASVCLSGWLWHGKREMGAKIERLEGEIVAIIKAQGDAEMAALAARAAEERRHQTNAERADHDHAKSLALADERARRYAAANRVRPAPACGASVSTTAAADNRSAGVPESAPPDPFVVGVSLADFNACTGAATYAMSAHEWAKGLNASPDIPTKGD